MKILFETYVNIIRCIPSIDVGVLSFEGQKGLPGFRLNNDMGITLFVLLRLRFFWLRAHVLEDPTDCKRKNIRLPARVVFKTKLCAFVRSYKRIDYIVRRRRKRVTSREKKQTDENRHKAHNLKTKYHQNCIRAMTDSPRSTRRHVVLSRFIRKRARASSHNVHDDNII